ncbi:MAG: di-trans,poly-cis-decaprenylcistransferase [Candidatus Aenigmarchaeota archaeon]|nr:di-trans,poly-cis-decaprenylcistransferase [Candidatus Aenigmarchaeota archaeon]
MTKKSNQKVPKHLAIIMDGNRRWARKRKLPIPEGHRRGRKAFRDILKHCGDLGIKIVTVYVFSTENWKRSKEEVKGLIGLLEESILKEADRLDRNNVNIRILGDITAFSKKIQKKLLEVIKKTKDNKGLCLNLALNYGGRAEITNAINKLINKNKKPKITEKDIEKGLYTFGEPDPDLLIRTGGVYRLSNFLLWQLSYTELYFTNTLWPDFSPKELDKAIYEFGNRIRNFGK